MASLEDLSASFIVRMWAEPARGEHVPVVWRGSIEHVPSGRRIFFRELGAIVPFVQPYVDRMVQGDADAPP